MPESVDVMKTSAEGKDYARESFNMRNVEEYNPLTRVLLMYLNPLIDLGYARPLEEADLGECAPHLCSNVLKEKFETEWERECSKPLASRSLWWVLWRTVGYDRLALSMFLYALYAALGYIPIILLRVLVRHFSGQQEITREQLWLCVAAMFVVPSLASIFAAQSNVIVANMAVQFRNCLINKIMF